jgi:sporulation protein YlmC with PRC-barrel domain
VKLSQVLGAKVTTTGGRDLGRVWDVRARHHDESLVLTGLVVGRTGLLARLGLRHARLRGQPHRRQVIPWSDIVVVGEHQIVVRG